MYRRTLLGGLLAAPLAALGWKRKPDYVPFKNYTAEYKHEEPAWRKLSEHAPSGDGYAEYHFNVENTLVAINVSIGKTVEHNFGKYKIVADERKAEVWEMLS